MGAVVRLEFLDVGRPRFADQHGIGFVRCDAQLLQNIVHFGKFLVVNLVGIRVALRVLAR